MTATVAPQQTLGSVPIRAALFDLDGTLLDTPGAIADQMAMATYDICGRWVSRREVLSLIGLPLEVMCSRLARATPESPLTAKLVAAYRMRYLEQIVPAAEALVFSGVQTGLRRLREHGLRLAIVTSKTHQSATTILDGAGLSSLFDCVVGVDDVSKPKPNPASGRLALQRLGLSPAQAVMVGDTQHDVGMGSALGARTIAVTYGVANTSTLAAAEPTWTVSDFRAAVGHILNSHGADAGSLFGHLQPLGEFRQLHEEFR